MTGRRSTGRQSTAVMANRAPKGVEDADPQVALHRALDFFPTPPWAARAGGELIAALDPGLEGMTGWEPACGQGHMADALAPYFGRLFASDVAGFHYGDVADFLDPRTADDVGAVDWIVTNPPFKAGAAFAVRGLQVARRGVALLLRLPFLESEGRFELLYGDRPLTVLAPFVERVSMQLGSWDPQLATATAYAWFVWRVGGPRACWPVIRPIPPGTRARLHRAEDVRRWCAPAAAPLLEGGRL